MTLHSSEEKSILNEHIKDCEVSLMQLINQRLGIVIHKHQVPELHKTILEACHKFNCTPETYMQILSNCSFDSPVLMHLVSGITIGETYFFRDSHQMKLLQEILLPQIIAKKRKQGELSLRIWSAGCATGEEIYTVMMMIHEMLSDRRRWTLQLIGTDINTVSLQKAMIGNYTQWSMRTIPAHYKHKFFTEEDNHYQISDDIRKDVSFSYLNLNDDYYPSIANGTNAQDLILCCNVLIYFDNFHIEQLMKKLSTSLVTGGYLILGASDPVVLEGTNLVSHHHHGIYFSQATEAKKTAPKLIAEDKKLTPIKQAINKKIHAAIPPIKKTTVTVDSSLISKLLNDSRWHDALDNINSYDIKELKSVFLLNAKATALANLGKLEQAAECCQDALVFDATNKHTYFINAVILLELNQLEEAEALLRKTLFLDHQFVEAHFQLGLLLLRNKKYEAGIKSLQNALDIAKNKNPTELVSEYHGLDYKQLADILQNEINLYVASQGKNNGKDAKN
jgi:chemotaxis protein methyltransferase CheR